jgi:hypothetical protein
MSMRIESTSEQAPEQGIGAGGDSEPNCLADEFADLAQECVTAVLEAKERIDSSGLSFAVLDNPESVIPSDVLRIFAVFANACDPPREALRLCYGIFARLLPTKFPLDLIDEPGMQTVLRDPIRDFEHKELSPPIALICLAASDRLHEGSKAKRAAIVYGLLITEVLGVYLKESLDDIVRIAYAVNTAKGYLRLFSEYLSDPRDRASFRMDEALHLEPDDSEDERWQDLEE